MTTKRRGGQKSGSYPRLGTTPGSGIPAPSATQLLADMSAQLAAFSQEVRELKGLIADLRSAPKARGAGYETTESLDVTAFRRARRQRTFTLAAAVAVPLMLVTVWGVWPDPAPRKVASVASAPSKPAAPALPPAPLPAPVKLVQVDPAPPAHVSVPAPPRARKAAPPQRLETPPPPQEAPPTRPSRAVHFSAQELSGGAPILD